MTVAAFGCTTDRTLGYGQPDPGAPALGSAAAYNTTGGGEREAVLPPPMTSSSSGSISGRFDAARPAPSASPDPLHADDAAAIMAAHQRVRVLGPTAPGPATQSAGSVAAGDQGGPGQGYTINQTPFSRHVAGLTDGGNGVSIDGGMTSSSVVSGSAMPVTQTAASAGLPTTTEAALGVNVGSFAAGPGTRPGAVPGAIAVPGAVAGSTGALAAVASRTNLNAAQTATAVPASEGSGRAAVANPVRIVPRSAGGVLITNVTAGSRR